MRGTENDGFVAPRIRTIPLAPPICSRLRGSCGPSQIDGLKKCACLQWRRSTRGRRSKESAMTRKPANAILVMFLLAAVGLITLGVQALHSLQSERENAAMPVVRMERVVITADRLRAPDATAHASAPATTLR